MEMHFDDYKKVLSKLNSEIILSIASRERGVMMVHEVTLPTKILQFMHEKNTLIGLFCEIPHGYDKGGHEWLVE